MTIRTMTRDDLQTVLGWAEDEGWNPGLDDAAAFYAADPEGFLIKDVNGVPAAAISVVNHDPDFAFLGLYLCKADYRGQGHGIDIWRAGISHAETRRIGLDGVPDQQSNYARSGFKKFGSTIRFEGRIEPLSDITSRLATPSDKSALIARDAAACGIKRSAFASAWFNETANRKTVILGQSAQISAFATFRRCPLGTKIGPLYADTEQDMQALLKSNPFGKSGSPVFIDAQDHGSDTARLMNRLGFEPGFETARMFTGVPPETNPFAFQAIATMELG